MASVQTANDVVQFVDADGVFAGASLDGAVISSRESLNQEYYGQPVTARDIVMRRTVTESGAAAPLEQQLSRL